MQTLTPKERLEVYERALTDYEKAIGKNEDYLRDNRLLSGLCYYFIRIQGINVCGHYMKNRLPELYLQKPDSEVGLGYWFQWAELSPRIECLKKAIELTKKTYSL